MDVSIVPVGLDPSSEPQSFGPVQPKFKFGRNSDGTIVPASGLSFLASRVIFYLLTDQGADPVNPQLGGSIGPAGTLAADRPSFAVNFTRSVLDVQDSMKEQQANSFTSNDADSRLASIRIMSIDFPTPDSANVSILITSESGKSGLFHLEV